MAKYSPGRIVKFIRNGESLTGNISPLLNQEFQLSFSNNYQSLVDNETSRAMLLAGNIIQSAGEALGLNGTPNFTQHKVYGMQLWANSEPLSFNLQLEFFMGSHDEWSGYSEVYAPIMKILGSSLPSEGFGDFLKGPGPSIFSQAKELLDIPDNKILSVQIGQLFLIRNIVLKNAEPVFSKEYDENGFPVSATLDCSISTVNIATIEMLEQFQRDRIKKALDNQELTEEEIRKQDTFIKFDKSQYIDATSDASQKAEIESTKTPILSIE